MAFFFGADFFFRRTGAFRGAAFFAARRTRRAGARRTGAARAAAFFLRGFGFAVFADAKSAAISSSMCFILFPAPLGIFLFSLRKFIEFCDSHHLTRSQ